MQVPRWTAIAIAAGSMVIAAVPAQAAAKPHAKPHPKPQVKAKQATVLAVDRKHHVLRLVTPARAALSLRYTGKLGKRITLGARIAYVRRGKFATKVKFRSRTRGIKVRGVVRKSGHALGIRLADGKLFSMAGASRAGGVSISLVGLEPGTQVEVSITFAGSNVNIRISVLDPSDDDGDGGVGSLCDAGNCRFSFDGSVSVIDAESGLFVVDLADGSVAIAASDDLLADLAEGDRVHVVGTQSPDDGSYTATAVRVDGTDDGDGGECADCTSVAVDGVVAAIDADGGSFTVYADGGEVTFGVDADLIAALHVGDQVHVEGVQDGDGGLTATSVEAMPDGS